MTHLIGIVETIVHESSDQGGLAHCNTQYISFSELIKQLHTRDAGARGALAVNVTFASLRLRYETVHRT